MNSQLIFAIVLLNAMAFGKPLFGYTIFLKEPVSLSGETGWCDYKKAAKDRRKKVVIPQLVNFAARGVDLKDFIDAKGEVNEDRLRSHAEEITSEEADVEETLASLKSSLGAMSYTETGYTECFRLVDFKTMVFCSSSHRLDMTSMFTRMSGYYEGFTTIKPGEIAPLESLEVRLFQRLIGGHNIGGDAILHFWQEISELRASVNAHEKEFQASILPEIINIDKQFGSAYLAATSPLDPFGTLGHELLHGPWEEVDGYKEAVMEYVARVSDEDKALLEAHIGQIQKSGEAQFANEFQAYAMMPTIHYSVVEELVEFARRHRVPIANHLRERGFEIPVLSPGRCEPYEPWPLDCKEENKARCDQLNLVY